MPAADPDRTHVLLISTDHWPGSLLGVAGHPAVQTPTIDTLARNGVYYPNAYSECPVCVPARRTMHTSLGPWSHGSWQNDLNGMPKGVTSMAQAFRDAGYQANAVGKIHTTPQRDRIGFDGVILDEEGRVMEGVGQDDYELFLADHGHAGERFAGGMNNNLYVHRPWHLDERLHVTNWAASQMCRTIKRRDPTRPAFWYLSFCHPHPPLVPLQAYLDYYLELEHSGLDIPMPHHGGWSQADDRPTRVKQWQNMKGRGVAGDPQLRAIRRAFYALCTQIDHQLRRVIGTLREEGLLHKTAIAFTADHGDMLGNHGMWAKQHPYDDSCRVPMLLTGAPVNARADGHGITDDRLVATRDIMPTLLDLAGITPPDHCEGKPMLGEDRHEHVYGGWGTDGSVSNRYLRRGRHKLCYLPLGSVAQLFDLEADPRELNDLAGDDAHAETLGGLKARLVGELKREGRSDWLDGDALAGVPDEPDWQPGPNHGMSGQRGDHLPPPAAKTVSWA